MSDVILLLSSDEEDVAPQQQDVGYITDSVTLVPLESVKNQSLGVNPEPSILKHLLLSVNFGSNNKKQHVEETAKSSMLKDLLLSYPPKHKKVRLESGSIKKTTNPKERHKKRKLESKADVIVLTDEEENDIQTPKKTKLDEIENINLDSDENSNEVAKVKNGVVSDKIIDLDCIEIEDEVSKDSKENVPPLKADPDDLIILEPNINTKCENVVLTNGSRSPIISDKLLSDDEIPSTSSVTSRENESNSSKINGKRKEITLSNELQSFFDFCVESTENPKHKQCLLKKLDVLKKVYGRANSYVESEEFLKLVKESSEKLRIDPSKSIVLFADVFSNIQNNPDIEDANDRKLAKLYDLLADLKKKIKHLEEEEVDFDAEDNSSYIKMQKYRARAALVHKEIQKRQNKDHRCGRIYYSRLDFCWSSYTEINRAINKAFNDRDKNPFPSYRDVLKCVTRCVKQHNLKIDKEFEAKNCFEALGNLLQRRRLVDFRTMVSEYHQDVNIVDPAKDDPELNKQLNLNRKQGDKAMADVLLKFSEMQQRGYNPVVSDDSDDSNQEDSVDEDIDEEENKDENTKS